MVQWANDFYLTKNFHKYRTSDMIQDVIVHILPQRGEIGRGVNG